MEDAGFVGLFLAPNYFFHLQEDQFLSVCEKSFEFFETKSTFLHHIIVLSKFSTYLIPENRQFGQK